MAADLCIVGYKIGCGDLVKKLRRGRFGNKDSKSSAALLVARIRSKRGKDDLSSASESTQSCNRGKIHKNHPKLAEEFTLCTVIFRLVSNANAFLSRNKMTISVNDLAPHSLVSEATLQFLAPTSSNESSS